MSVVVLGVTLITPWVCRPPYLNWLPTVGFVIVAIVDAGLPYWVEPAAETTIEPVKAAFTCIKIALANPTAVAVPVVMFCAIITPYKTKTARCWDSSSDGIITYSMYLNHLFYCATAIPVIRGASSAVRVLLLKSVIEDVPLFLACNFMVTAVVAGTETLAMAMPVELEVNSV